MLGYLRNHVWGPADKAVAAVACLVIVGAGVFLGVQLTDSEPCEGGLVSRGEGECVGVTAEAVSFGDDGMDSATEDVVRSVAEENEKVRRSWEEAEDGSGEPYVRVALMMPYTSRQNSAMNQELIRHSLAGVHAAQRSANSQQLGVNFQLLLGNIGRNLDQWKPVVDQLDQFTADSESPLAGVIGLPNSRQDTQDAAQALDARGIPTISGVLSSPDMSADHLFKVSPSNEHFIEALAAYLEKHPGKESGYLVWDSRSEDNYVTNTQRLMRNEFGKDYGLSSRNNSFLGIMGEGQGTPRRFSPAAEGICKVQADTVFYAGRDSDLPHLITQLSREPECESHEGPIRILRVTTGLDPGLVDPDVRDAMESADIVTLSAAATDAASWRIGEGATPSFELFREQLEAGSGLRGEELDDGYAITHYDAFQVLQEAVDQAKSDLEEQGKADRLPSKDDVYNTIKNMRLVRTDGSDSCVNCVRGAGGTFGYEDEKGNWPVCKPVPVISFPPDPERTKPYRTFQAPDGTCPA